MKRINRKGFTLVEGLVTLTLATLILFGVFQSSFTSSKAKVQTEQTMEVENLIASRFAEFQATTPTIPFQEEETVQTDTATYTLLKTVEQEPEHPYCARVKIVVTWKQGLVPQTREIEGLIPLKDAAGSI